MGIFDSFKNAAQQAADSGQLEQATDAIQDQFGAEQTQQDQSYEQEFDGETGQADPEFDAETGQADQQFDSGQQQSFDQGQAESYDQGQDQPQM